MPQYDERVKGKDPGSPKRQQPSPWWQGANYTKMPAPDRTPPTTGGGFTMEQAPLPIPHGGPPPGIPSLNPVGGKGGPQVAPGGKGGSGIIRPPADPYGGIGPDRYQGLLDAQGRGAEWASRRLAELGQGGPVGIQAPPPIPHYGPQDLGGISPDYATWASQNTPGWTPQQGGPSMFDPERNMMSLDHRVPRPQGGKSGKPGVLMGGKGGPYRL